MKIKDAMTKNVITISPENSLEEAIDIFSENNISGAPVVENRKIVGVLSDSDILKKIGLKDLFSLKPGDVEKIKKMISGNVKDIMKKSVFSINEDGDVSKAIKIMNEKDVNRLPVVDKKGNLVGILTRGDVVRVFSKSLGSWLLLEKKAPIILETDVDKLLKIIEEKGTVTTEELAKILKVEEEKVEEWGRILEEHGLIKMEYPPLGKPLLKAVGK